ncbi:pentatricopeptide repeat-containing protein At2g40240, mitochondrial-like [Vigna unguiculata]|uniref:pentatricopeptide repeat-containing protein At2g40240, mitochondrial-like n=1 Tax=Vigna unguiculata TaxID=3917 RepID=UPI0010162641|nr:pentatricopeptide repeat-containing protein At2g40240, mitochondrial-like [Vigna unguiculata]
MLFFRKTPNITLKSLSYLRRRFATTLITKPFPDNPTVAYYDDLAADAFSSGDYSALRDVLNKRVQDGFKNSKHTFSFITHSNCSPSIIDKLVETVSHLNGGITRRNALDLLVTRLCKIRRTEEALRVIETLARGGVCVPAACTFYPILSFLTREKSLDHAWRVVDVMAEFGIRLDLIGYNLFLKAYCYGGEFDEAAGVLRKMEEEGIAADSRTFDALVLGACRAGKVDGAMVILRRMVDDGVYMMYSTHMYVIGALLRMKCYEDVMRYVRSFVGRDKLLDAQLLGVLASKLMNLKKVEEAMSILEEMKQRGVPMGYKLRDFYKTNAGKENGARVDAVIAEGGNGV